MMPLDEFRFLQEFLRARIGLRLADDRTDLAEHRLYPVAASFELDDAAALVKRLRQRSEPHVAEAVVEAMVTKETSFFRGPRLFDQLRTMILPTLARARQNQSTLRIWCAGCATGQEPYSIAMTLAEHFFHLNGWRIRILATDVSEAALGQARHAMFNQFEVQRGLPVQLLVKYFRQVEHRWQLNDLIRRMVEFRPFNLLDPPATLGATFDLVLLRNVLIYFDESTRRTILSRLRRVIATDGFLVLGDSETTFGLTDEFTIPPESPGYYRPAQ